MADFLNFCLNHGLGGLALLLIVGAGALIVVLAVASGVMQLAGHFAEGYRRGSSRGNNPT